MAEEQQEMQEQVQMEDQGDSVPILVDRTKMTPQMRHYLTMSKMQSENAYKEEAAKVNSKNEFTKTFTDQAEYKINKAVHEATVDRNYKKGAAEAVENFKGHQNLGYDNPQMAHHAKNNEMLSEAYYKEDYEMEKDIVYFPMEASPAYVTTKKVKEATDDVHYKAKAAENNQLNKLNLCETPVYQTHEALKGKVSNKAYTKDYEEAKINVNSPSVLMLPMAWKRFVVYNNDASMLNRGDIQQAQKTQKQDDHLKREYRKDYEANKTNYEFEKALNDVPVIKQQILASKQADATNTTYGAGGKQSMERNEFTKTYCDTAVYKTNKAITAITRDSLYQAGKNEAIKSFKGFQALDINQVPSFKQHMANQENLSNVYYTDDYENEKDLVYFPTNITAKYEADKKNAELNADYKTQAAKDAETHKFNLAESETYRNQKDVENKTRPKAYTEKWEQDKCKVIGTAVTKEMELNETLKKTKDSAYTEDWNKAKLNIHYPPDNPLMIQAKKSAQQASDIQYKKDYRENVLGAKSGADAEGDLEYVVNRTTKAITDDHNYKKDAKDAFENHQYAPEFCETEKYKIAKNITEITSDRYNTTKETLKNFQGWNTINPADNPLIIHHANNADQLNPYLYKEDYEVEKTLVDYPVHMSEHYQNTKNLKNTLDGYTEKYEKMKQHNELDLTKTEKYINDEALSKNYRSDKGYKAKYEKEVQGHMIGSETNPQLEQLKALKQYQNDKLYQEGAREAMRTTNVPADAPEFELSKKRHEIRSDKHYKKNYEETKAKNIPGPIENYHDYKTQADVKAITNDAAYKKKYNETVVTNSITKEFCNTEQYKTNKNLKTLTSKANYSDFPETLAKYKGFQSIDTNEVPEFAMHARNADQLSQPLYKEDYNNEKDLVFFPVHMSEKYQQDKQLNENMKNYDANYQAKKHEVHFNHAETEKYLQDKEHRAKTGDSGYKKEWTEKVQGTTVGTARTIEMERNDTLKITKDSAYKAGAKERMQTYSRSLQDPDYEQMSKSQVQRSDKDYKKDYNENVLGKNIGAPIEGHLDYYNQKKVKEITQDSAYTADAKDRMRSFVLEPNAPFVRNAIDVQKQVNMASYRKSGKEVIDKFKGFQQLDIYSNPYLNRHIVNSENLSNNFYKEEYEIDKDCVYFPYNTTEKYAADKKLHETTGDIMYTENHKKQDWKHNMDLCATEKYQQDAKLVAENQGVRYKAKYLEDVSKGKAGGKLVHTWEMDAMQVMKKMRDQAYTAGAKQLQRKYDLMLDDNKLSHLMKVQDVCNARLYKKDYNESTLGKGAADPGIAYPYYKEQAKLTEKMQANEYTRAAKERMEKPENYVRWDELRRSRKVALQCKDSEYRKSFHDAVKSMKGFQQLDIFQNPYMSRHIVNAENASDVYYKEDYENNKDVVYFPVQITERFQDIKKNAEIEADYKTEAKKIQAKVTFDAASTEKYNTDKLLRESLGAQYSKKSAEINARPAGIDKTMEMERIEKLRIVQGTNYAAEAKRLSMKYGLTADDTKLANSLLSAKITSDRLYHEHYNKHVRGTTAQNPEIAYEIEVTRNKNAAKIRSDNIYKKEAMKNAERNEYTKQKYTEAEKARLVALQCNDSEYQKGKREAIDDFKGYMRMDASLHPVVTRGILVSEMQSNAIYREDWEMEKDLIYYPLNMTPGYEQLKAADEYKSDANYKAKWEQDKVATKFNAALTEKYNNDLEIRKVQSDATYRSEWNEKQRHEFKTPARTMEMERFEPLRKLTNKSYAMEAKKLGEKYGLVHDDITLRNLMAVGGIASQIAYKKAYNAEDLGKSSKADFNGYLPYVTQRDVKAATNDAAYTKDAKNIMKHNVVAQSNEELRARSVALSMRDSEYKKSMYEAIETCKGFMRMDAHLHPVVQRGILINEIISPALYKEEWELEKDAIYFPVQMTPGYETATTSTKQSSDLLYKADYNASKHQNKFDPTLSEKYQADKIDNTSGVYALENLLAERAYVSAEMHACILKDTDYSTSV
ncbi:unnamed protein product [Oikopleura dioica]|uniref:SH3 domain-containing protein n=1 Tax=Oikopleura dioica TaxID=34765 RepID=E4X499_OIKDI|nr:unnamed protein product [Oikopleura dioica]